MAIAQLLRWTRLSQRTLLWASSTSSSSETLISLDSRTQSRFYWVKRTGQLQMRSKYMKMEAIPPKIISPVWVLIFHMRIFLSERFFMRNMILKIMVRNVIRCLENKCIIQRAIKSWSISQCESWIFLSDYTINDFPYEIIWGRNVWQGGGKNTIKIIALRL